MDLSERYLKNKASISDEDQAVLKASRVGIIGFGGLGERVAELLVRAGVGRLAIAEFDRFEASNLNRQLFSTEQNLGQSKLEVGYKHLLEIDSSVSLELIDRRIDETNAETLLAGCDCVVDCLDNAPSRKVAVDACQALDVPLVHGAVAGWRGRIAVIRPGSRLAGVFGGGSAKGVEMATGNPSPTVATAAALQAAETLKLLLGKDEDDGIERIIEFDLLALSFDSIDFS